MIAAAGAFLGKSLLMQSPIGGFLKAVPRSVWIALAVAAALLIAVRWHSHKVHELETTSFNAGYAKAVADGKKGVAAIEKKSGQVSAEIRSKTDEETRHIARHADALRVRGPGAAACLNPALPAGAGGHGQAGGEADAAGGRLPDQDRAAVPFTWLVDSAEVADANRAEVLAWREWHQRLTAEWDKYRGDLAKADAK